MSTALRLGIAGLGTVGAGVVKIVQAHADMLALRAGRDIEITCVSAQSRNKERGVDLSGYGWVDDALDMARRDDVDCVVEMIGGSEGLAYDLVRAALENGKHVVTANKALLAHYGVELARIAEQNNVSLMYEAAVAGGIPIIKALREGFAGNEITAIYGILNGTCNYILTQMRETGNDFDSILKDAQQAGYAEADPSFDVDGVDAGHKLALMAAIAFGMKPDFENLSIKGIRQINTTDIEFAQELGYRIKLLGIARNVDGQYSQMLEPCLVPANSPLGMVEDVYNAVFVTCDSVETPLLTGKGAGGGPTASAVLSDVMDLARGTYVPTFGIPVSALQTPKWQDARDAVSSYYLRLSVLDKPGAVADISAVLRDHAISIEGLLQRSRDPNQPVPLVITTHETRHGAMLDACAAFENLDTIIDEPCLLRIEPLE